MPRLPIDLKPRIPLIVGSFGNSASLASLSSSLVKESCDIVEIRLDLIAHDIECLKAAPWRRFKDMPLLFTARRKSEGGSGDLDAETRMSFVRSILDEASLIDIEVASVGEMQPLIDELADQSIPWIGSFHNFTEVSGSDILSAHRMAARNAGAAGFKAAVELGWNMDQLAPLSAFIQQSADYPVSLMGMGPLAPVSRILFAQLGSVLNYGYLGDTPTAPGQWSARQLKEAVHASSKA